MLESSTVSTSYDPSSFENSALETAEQVVEGFISSPGITRSTRRRGAVNNNMMYIGFGLAALLGLAIGTGSTLLFRKSGTSGGALGGASKGLSDFKTSQPEGVENELSSLHSAQISKKLYEQSEATFRMEDVKSTASTFNSDFLTELDDLEQVLVKEQIAITVEVSAKDFKDSTPTKSDVFANNQIRLNEIVVLRSKYSYFNQWKEHVHRLVTLRGTTLSDYGSSIEFGDKAEAKTAYEKVADFCQGVDGVKWEEFPTDVDVKKALEAFDAHVKVEAAKVVADEAGKATHAKAVETLKSLQKHFDVSKIYTELRDQSIVLNAGLAAVKKALQTPPPK